jgi:hypothetical protein
MNIHEMENMMGESLKWIKKNLAEREQLLRAILDDPKLTPADRPKYEQMYKDVLRSISTFKEEV